MTDIINDLNGSLTVPRLAAVVAVLVLGGVVTGFVTGSAQETAPSATGILDRAEQRYETAESYSSVVSLNATYNNGTEPVQRSAKVRVQYRQPDSYRMELLAPTQYNGTVAATNGSVAWVAGGTGTAVVESLNASHQDMLADANVSAAIDRLKENATISKHNTTTVDGNRMYVLSVAPENESYDASAMVWIDADDYRVHKITTEGEKDGTRLSATMRVESTQFDVSIHESTFQPPEDRTVVFASLNRTEYDSLDAARTAVDFPVATPTLPAGFTAGEIVVSTQDEQSTVVASYENETASVHVVQSERNPLPQFDDEVDTETVELDTVTASYARLRDTGAVYWQTDNRTYGVTGDHSKTVLVDVAASIVGEASHTED